jgi:prevent-host-death family protein
MQSVSIRDLTHNFSRYLSSVKAGESITILERNHPVADIIPYSKNIRYPGWKRPLVRRKIKGEAFSDTFAKVRAQE